MKNTNANNKLNFSKLSVSELNDTELNQVKGGSTDVIRVTIELTTYGTWLTVL